MIVVTKSVQGDVWAFFVEAFRATDGERLWRTPVGSIDALDFTQPAADARLVIYPSPDGNLYALNAANGSLRWKVRIATDLAAARKHSAAAIANGVVWIVTTEGGKARLRALDPRNGRQVWLSAQFSHVEPAARPLARCGRRIRARRYQRRPDPRLPRTFSIAICGGFDWHTVKTGRTHGSRSCEPLQPLQTLCEPRRPFRRRPTSSISRRRPARSSSLSVAHTYAAS